MQGDEDGPLELQVNPDCELNFGLRWDFVGDAPVDVDASCISFDVAGNAGELVYFNKLTTPGEWMVHTGDNTTGEGDDDDEAVQVSLMKVPDEVFSLVLCVTCHNPGCTLGDLESIVCRVSDLESDAVLCRIPVNLSRNHPATIVFNLHRKLDEEGWVLQELNAPSQGHSLGDHNLLTKMRDLLPVHEEYLGQRAELNVVIDSQKKTVAQIRPDVKHLVFGVGWLRGTDDIDCTVIFFDKDGQYCDHVNSKNKLVSTDGSVVHQGDNVGGTGAKSADKEIVDLHIRDVSPNIDSIFFCVSTVERDGQWTGKLSSVSGAYCRLLELKKKVVGRGQTHNIEDRKELVRTNLTKAKDATGLVFAALYRDPSSPAGWHVQPVVEVLTSLPIASISPSEFMPVARALARFIRYGMPPSTLNNPSQVNYWPAFREVALKRRLLTVKVVEGRDFAPQGKTFSCHCQLWTMYKGQSTVKARTAATSDRQSPRWDESFPFYVTLYDSIKILCFDRYFVGMVEIPLVAYHSRLNDGEVLDSWHPLTGEDVEGELRLEIHMCDDERRIREPEAGRSCCVS